MTQANDDLQSQLREWLQREGYPFEMKVAQAFAKAGFAVQQSEYYEDPETGSPREVDVVATIQRSTPKDLIFRLVFLVECKSSLDKPWLLFCSTKRAPLSDSGRVAQRVSSKVAVHVLFGIADDKDVQNLALFRIRDPAGYGLRQAFLKEKQKDAAYAAMASIADAARAAAKHWTKHAHEPRVVEIIFPVIAIDGRLFKCWLDEATVLSVSEISYGSLLWRTPFGHLSNMIVDVQTAASIEEFATESFESARTLLTNYYDTVGRLSKLSSVVLPARED